MSTYAIGDVQGCFDELQALLTHIQFDITKDSLWFVGDLVNRGPKSLETLRFIKNLPRAKVVLGNHDLHLLALATGHTYAHHTLNAILTAPDRDELIDWLRCVPLLHHDAALNFVMVHAGISPQWDLATAKACADEISQLLQSDHWRELINSMYGNEPNLWDVSLTGPARWRFIINAFTRMRFCDVNGRLDFTCDGPIGKQPAGYLPWFSVPNRRTVDAAIVFGHWAALSGEVDVSNIHGIDTGCVWGKTLTALRLEDRQRFSVACRRENLF